MEFIYNNSKLKAKRRELRNEMTRPEQILWYYLRGRNLNGYKFRRQYSVGIYILDFYCPELRLGIEVDGDSHFINEDTVKLDTIRSQFIESKTIKIIRFTNTDVTGNLEEVIEKIKEQLP